MVSYVSHACDDAYDDECCQCDEGSLGDLFYFLAVHMFKICAMMRFVCGGVCAISVLVLFLGIKVGKCSIIL